LLLRDALSDALDVYGLVQRVRPLVLQCLETACREVGSPEGQIALMG
jgi:truncated hemoglobin YjbI